MELLFSWINRTKNGVIQKQGINYSPKYDFIVNYSEDKVILSLNKAWKSKDSIYQTGVIENVTSVIGKNGSGKTSLLKYLANLDCLIPHQDNNIQDYELLYKKGKQKSLCIWVFRDCNIVTIYHNLEDKFVNDTEWEAVDASNIEQYNACVKEQSGFKSFTKLYITNSSFTPGDGIFQQGKLDKLYLTPNSMSTIASSFYKKTLRIGTSGIYKDTFNKKWHDVLKAHKNLNDFQQICDVLFFNRLFDMKKYEEYAGKINTKLVISIESALTILYEKMDRINFIGENAGESKQFFIDIQNSMKESIETFEDENVQMKYLVTNFLCEVSFALELDYPKDIHSWNKCKEWYNSLKDESMSIGENGYFDKAVDEIEKLIYLLQNAKPADNLVPNDDLAYDNSVVLDYSIDSKTYCDFLNYVAERVSDEYSFILRYIQIGNLNMSSGERAFQNIFSWIHMVPMFKQFNAGMSVELRKNILLLIDELDLYLHPEWQRKFVKMLIEEVESQFQGYKVQIIFATHSPLCLSDIPRENTVYLKTVNGLMTVENRMLHKQTFARDIYTLFNDAFYLDDVTMGEFAKNYIDDIINSIIDKDKGGNRKLSFLEVQEIEKKLSFVGNNALKNKLQSMLLDCFDGGKKLQYLNEKKNQIDQQIAELEAMNDKN